ncbi:hypothetical protein Tco_0652056 [Tanacetum coccineum]|uniref:Uncharacterized protein n=1 Tax=Tanacetum coccineum TaxID=301880 RepID=A0ABQ4WWI3_9ASTR
MKGLSECKALESNIKRIRVKDIVKEVEDYLKTYSSARMDISWQETQYLLKARQKTSDPISWLYKFACKLDILSSLLVQRMMKEAPRSGHLWLLQRMSLQLERLMQDHANGLDYTHVDLHYVERKHVLDKLLSMTDGDERKHVLDYTHVDLHYVEDQRKNLVTKFNLLKQEISLHNKVTLDQLLSKQVPRNIVKALGGKGRRKEKISSKEVVFTKVDESSSKLAPEITSDSESECDS